MANFMIRFFICNVFISGIIGILLIVKRIFKNSLSSRMQYNLWFLLLGLLAVPFIPFRFIGLPQLFNILKGDMSLVGPRPERPLFVEKFREEIPRYMVKHQVRPGMTGWAQINGYRGDTSIKRRIEFDLYYIENWTVGLDIKILILTIFKGFINKNAY